MRFHPTSYLSIFLAALTLAFLSGCFCEPLELNDSLSAMEQDRIHYQAGQELEFVHDSGQHMHVKVLVGGRSVETEQTLSYCEGCCPNIHHAETFSVGLSASDGTAFEAYIKAKRKAFSDEDTWEEEVMSVIECRLSGGEFLWSVDVDTVSNGYGYLLRTLHDSLEVRGHTYHRVWEVPRAYGYLDNSLRTARIWYAEDGGIVRMMQTDSTKWERVY